ncbi:adenylyl-sulfate kinase [Rhodomicrobium lacus]|uniref:adenylyl-sulfate kinase n=1 Tax=Rhodomicrobium lacus TaxID=2498452 RepID=UPI001FE18681|nr:adenylyl-sulfate kinase [Rhodomicrobium lacus]
MQRKILIMGLPGAGKTTLARELAPLLNAVLFNADEVRANVNRDLGFSVKDRIEQARRMGWLCDQVVKAGGTAIADFICPTAETRDAFGPALTIWLDRIREGRFQDTNKLFAAPEKYDMRVTAEGSPRHWAERILQELRPVFDPKKPTALFLGRYQPFHDGHRRLIEEGIRRVGQACVAVRDTQGTNEKNPFSFFDVKQRIEAGLSAFAGRYVIVPLPNISHVFYGRDVGYAVERIYLDDVIEAVSATKIRDEAGA